jgi:hypothetical protein
LHRSNTCVLEEKPIVHLIPLAATLGVRDLVLGIIALNQVLHDASRLEQIDCLAIGKFVGKGRNSAIGVDGKKPVLLLCVLTNVNLLDLVGKTNSISESLPTRDA